MHHIQLNDQLYQEAQRRADEGGFASVDDYVAARLQQDFEETENLDHLFTPERLAAIDRAASQMDSGQGIPSAQVFEHFRRTRSAGSQG